MKKLILFLALSLFLNPVSHSQVLYSETFDSGGLPAGWSNDSLGNPAIHLWTFDNLYGRSVTGTLFDSLFAIFDSDQGGFDNGFGEDAQITSPLISLAPASVSLWLEFDEQFVTSGPPDGGMRYVEMSTDGGSSWTIIDQSDSDIGFPNPAVHSVYDISSALADTSLLIRFHYTGNWDFWWAVDNVSIISRQPCSNPVNAGIAQSSQTVTCPGIEFFLFLSGDDQAQDLSYQWQSSPDNINWFDIVGLVSNTAYHSQTTNTYYRCAITCAGITAYSGEFFIQIDNPMNCYCIPEFVDGCDAILKVAFNTLLNDSSDCNLNDNLYINYPDTGLATTTVYADSIYNLLFSSGAGSGDHGAAAWFDFNHDGDFRDAGEFFLIGQNIQEFSPEFSIPIYIPSTAFGPTRMRIRYIYDFNAVLTSDCEPYGYGETEDYTITILNPIIGIDEITPDLISVYPIPACGKIQISSGDISLRGELTMMDQMGRVVFDKLPFSGKAVLNVEEYSRGIYFIRIDSSRGTVTKKVILN